MARKWLWDKTIRQAALSQKLEHQPLSDQYLVTDLNTGIKRHFQSLQHALEFMGTINNYPFFELTALEQGKTYTAQVRARLNTESLPTPLRLSAISSLPIGSYLAPGLNGRFSKETTRNETNRHINPL